MKKISLIFEDDADADEWHATATTPNASAFELKRLTAKARILVSKRKGKVKAAINKATL